jgi:hypothetical protein
MINVQMCRGCGRALYVHPVANLEVRCEVDPLDAQASVQELLGGNDLWELRAPKGLAPANPVILAGLSSPDPAARPVIVREHRCTAFSGPPVGAVVPGHPKAFPSSPAGRQTPSWGQSTERSGAPAAVSPRGDQGNPRCDECGLIMGDGEYVAVQLGEIVMWAQHLENCRDGS